MSVGESAHEELVRREREARGKQAFGAYREAVGRVTYDDKPIPLWDDIGETQKIGWRAAAQAVLEEKEMT